RPDVRLSAIPLRYRAGRLDSSLVALLAAVRADDRDLQLRAKATATLAAYAFVHGRVAEGARLLADARAQDSARGAAVSSLVRAEDAARWEIWLYERPERALRILDSALAHA